MWPNSGAILPAAFADTGVRVVAFRPHSVEPSGGGFLYGYEVDTVDGAGTSATVLTYIDTDPAALDGSVGQVVDPDTGREVRVWAYPQDPALPALAGVTYPDRVAHLLVELGIAVTAPTLSVAAYRPGKRAVIKVEAPEDTVFLKVVRPARAEPIALQHEAFLERGLPVPPVLAVRPDGLLALECARGVPAGTRIVDIAESPAFVDNVLTLTETIGAVSLDRHAQPDALDNAAWHRRSLVSSMPDQARRIDEVYDEIDRRRESWAPDELQVIHGDLHLEQLFVDPQDPGAITGLLDVDTAGLGHPARDAGALVAHLVVTAQWHRGNGATAEARACERVADDVVAAWTARNRRLADRLAPTIASQLLAHAGGQATLGTEIGRTKAAQLIDAAIGTMRRPVVAVAPPAPLAPVAPTMQFTPPA